MDRIVIAGGQPLEGTIRISGAKNAALPLMVASLLTEDSLQLSNIPHLADITQMAALLAQLGVDISMPGDGAADAAAGRVLTLSAGQIRNTFAPYDIVRKMRASFLVAGPLLARYGRAKVSLPGGCAIGARPVDLHLSAFEALGADIRLEDGYVYAEARNGLKGGSITFPFVSVGATENVLMAATLASGQTVIENAAREPEIVDLARCLSAMGAKIDGAGSSTIRVDGQDRLHGAAYAVLPDRIETGTYAMAAAVAGGNVTLIHPDPDLLASLWPLLSHAGIAVELDRDAITITNGTRHRSIDVSTEPFPGFPTDLQAQLMALLATAEGTSHIKETIFENRFMHVPELNRMGAKIAIDGDSATIVGVPRLTGAPVMATDLRASVSLVIAGLAAQGETEINRVYHLDRGFERIEEKLGACGARITRVKG